jgi:hypothetical protein
MFTEQSRIIEKIPVYDKLSRKESEERTYCAYHAFVELLTEMGLPVTGQRLFINSTTGRGGSIIVEVTLGRTKEFLTEIAITNEILNRKKL